MKIKLSKLPLAIFLCVIMSMAAGQQLIAQSTDSTPPSFNNEKDNSLWEDWFTEPMKPISTAWDYIQQSMTVDSLTQEAPSSFLYAQFEIARYQSILITSMMLSGDSAPFVSELSDIANIDFYCRADVNNTDTSNPVAVACASYDMSFYWRYILEMKAGTPIEERDLSLTPEYLAVFGNKDTLGEESLLPFSNLNRLLLDTTLGTLHLTPKESARFNQFRNALAAKCDGLLANTKAKGLAPEEEYAELSNDIILLALRDGCLYGYMNILLTHREHKNHNEETAAYKELQKQMTQFMANIDACNPTAFLEMQVDMLKYINSLR